MRKNKSLKPLLKSVGYLLNLFAFINVFFLFFNFLHIDRTSQLTYTIVSIFVLFIWDVLYLISNWKRKPLLLLAPDIFFVFVGLLVRNSFSVFQLYLLGRQIFLLIRSIAVQSQNSLFWKNINHNPPILVLFSFLLTIFMGTLLLMLPTATAKGEVTSLLGALFTSTSATCVTGLIVYDTGTHFTVFGQIVILLLIQIGGLGIMTVSSAFAIMLGQKLTLKSESMIQNVVGEANKLDMIKLVKSIIGVTFAFEFIGAVLLYLVFYSDMSAQSALYHSIFHSISAFCNAGFSLNADSFMAYRSYINLNLIVTSLIIFGGIGFPVLVDLGRIFSKRFRFSRFTLHSKIVITATVFLLLLGTLAFFIAEYNNLMSEMGLKERLLSSYFQSVTTRTAGFNTIDTSQLSKASAFTSVLLMYVGASPGSTGGGVKTTTFMIILISVISMMRGDRDVNVFSRKVSVNIIKRVMALIALSVGLLALMIYLLLLIEPFPFEQIVFEATSAFGTVGLSMGITPLLSKASQIIIIILMYLGRVGPLTLIFSLSEHLGKANFNYTEERIIIG